MTLKEELDRARAIARKREQFRKHHIHRKRSAVVFSDTDWPNIASNNSTLINRPVLAGSTLTWVGPSGGGANNGNPVQQSLSLSTQAGFTTTSNNQVISGLKLTSRLTIAHNNVLVKQCALDFADTELIAVGGSTTGLIVEDCWINGQKGSQCGFNAPAAPFQWVGTIRRCTILGCENNITGNPSITVSDTYLGQCGNVNTGTFDGDLIEDYQSTGMTVSNCTFDMQNSQTSPGTFNSCFNITNVGSPTGTTVTGCHFVNQGVASFIVCDDSSKGGGPASWACTNNSFFNIGGAAFRRNTGSGVNPSPNSGNYTAATFGATSGTLINGGSGQI